ncbi:hypothetical protein LguiA_024933 [Lonicera macranthoides]
MPFHISIISYFYSCLHRTSCTINDAQADDRLLASPNFDCADLMLWFLEIFGIFWCFIGTK